MLRTRNNTDGNKLVIFSSIALYYGDTYGIGGKSCNDDGPVAALARRARGKLRALLQLAYEYTCVSVRI